MILAIDGTNWIHSLYHAMRGSGPDAILTTFRRRIEIVGKAANAGTLLVGFDRRSFRHDLYEPYKATRAAKDHALSDLLARGTEAAGSVALGIYQEGYEADDLLATAAAAAAVRGERAILCSPDKDLWQCLAAKQTSVLLGFRTEGGAITAAEWWTEADLYTWPWKGTGAKQKEPYHLRPWQWADYQALVGESGDNVPGCPGWGPETAAAALVKHGSIAAMLQKPWEISVTRQKLTKLQNWAKESLALVRQLVTLRTDAAVVWDALR